MKETKISCDVCGKSEDKEKSITVKERVLDVIFVTDQNNGVMLITPHLSRHKLDICNECMATILTGKYLFGKGAQGRNKYYFKKT